MNNLLYNTGTRDSAQHFQYIIGSIFAAIIIIILLSGMAVIIYRCKRKKDLDGESGRFNMMVLYGIIFM